MFKILITGGAGFIGSHLVDRLIEMGNEVVVMDNLSAGSLENLEQHKNDPKFKFVKGDLLNKDDIRKCMKDIDIVYHLAANPDVRSAVVNTKSHFDQNVLATYNLLEVMKEMNVKKISFTSTSTVYGEANIIPTPEEYGPMIPISVYGSTKLAAEALIMSYCYTFNMKAAIFRLANIVGSRTNHGIIYDFIQKLKKNSSSLEILGDGSQCKSYLHVSDCVDAVVIGTQNDKERVEIYNVGSEDKITVNEMVNIILNGLELNNVKKKYTDTTGEGRGWKGDVKVMLLSVEKLKKIGWKYKYNSLEAFKKAVEELKVLF